MEGKLDISPESRPLPQPPKDSFNSNEMYSNRYEYFKSEIEKWKAQPSLSPKGKPKPRQDQQDHSLSWNLENEPVGNRQAPQSHAERHGHGQPDPREFKTKAKHPAPAQDSSENYHKCRDRILEDIVAGDTDEDKVAASTPARAPLQELRGSPKKEKNIFKDFSEFHPSERADRKSPLQESSAKADARRKKKLEIPPNLNLSANEAYIEFLKDPQNVLILISDLKVKFRKLNKDKQGLRDELKKAAVSSKALKEDLEAKSHQGAQALAQLGAALQDNKLIAKENAELKARLKDLEQLEPLKAELTSRETENQGLKLKIRQLQIDQNVLQEIIKEMINEKDAKGPSDPKEASHAYDTHPLGLALPGDFSLKYSMDVAGNSSLGYEPDNNTSRDG